MKQSALLLWLLPFATLAILVSSCDSKRFYEAYKPIDGESWSAANKQLFEVDMTDSNAVYSLYFNVRHTGQYRFQNLFVFLETTFPDGGRYRDTLECVLAEPNGKWYGSGIGDIKDHSFLFKRHVTFKEAGNYLFSFEQAMRVDPLLHVKDVGLRIEREA